MSERAPRFCCDECGQPLDASERIAVLEAEIRALRAQVRTLVQDEQVAVLTGGREHAPKRDCSE